MTEPGRGEQERTTQWTGGVPPGPLASSRGAQSVEPVQSGEHLCLAEGRRIAWWDLRRMDLQSEVRCPNPVDASVRAPASAETCPALASGPAGAAARSTAKRPARLSVYQGNRATRLRQRIRCAYRWHLGTGAHRSRLRQRSSNGDGSPDRVRPRALAAGPG